MELKERQLAFHITSVCNLDCKLCVNLMPRFKREKIARHISLEQIKQEISAVFQIYDYIEDVTISGGEPLLHPDVTEVVSFCMSYEQQFHSLRIFTNGTVVPKRRLIEQIKEYRGKLQLVVDDYGPGRSTRVSEITSLFKENALPLRVNHYWGDDQHCGGWVDYGPLEQYRGYSDSQLELLYQTCHLAQYKCIEVFNGKMLNCWAVFGLELGLMPFESDSPDPQIIDLLDTSISLEEKRRIAAAYGIVPLWACQYCNGFDPNNSERFPAGEQL